MGSVLVLALDLVLKSSVLIRWIRLIATIIWLLTIIFFSIEWAFNLCWLCFEKGVFLLRRCLRVAKGEWVILMESFYLIMSTTRIIVVRVEVRILLMRLSMNYFLIKGINLMVTLDLLSVIVQLRINLRVYVMSVCVLSLVSLMMRLLESEFNVVLTCLGKIGEVMIVVYYNISCFLRSYLIWSQRLLFNSLHWGVVRLNRIIKRLHSGWDIVVSHSVWHHYVVRGWSINPVFLIYASNRVFLWLWLHLLIVIIVIWLDVIQTNLLIILTQHRWFLFNIFSSIISLIPILWISCLRATSF